MRFKKGNKYAVGNKGGGRKSKEEEFKDCKKIMKKQTIEELAKDKVFKQLTTLEGRNKKDRQGIKDIALPVYLKSQKDTLEITLPKPLLGGKSK